MCVRLELAAEKRGKKVGGWMEGKEIHNYRQTDIRNSGPKNKLIEIVMALRALMVMENESHKVCLRPRDFWQG
jgi:hypothetical protein